MQHLRNELEKIVPISDDEWELVTSKFRSRSVKKGNTIHHAGEIFSSAWYLKSGLARSFFIDINGKELTWKLYFRDESLHVNNLFIDDSVSYYENEPSLLNFEVLEDSEFEVISMKELDLLLNQDKKWQYMARIFKHNTFYASTYKRAISIMSESAQQKYDRLLREYPNIFAKVKSYHIASYLGIAPQTLCKLRKSESR